MLNALLPLAFHFIIMPILSTILVIIFYLILLMRLQIFQSTMNGTFCDELCIFTLIRSTDICLDSISQCWWPFVQIDYLSPIIFYVLCYVGIEIPKFVDTVTPQYKPKFDALVRMSLNFMFSLHQVLFIISLNLSLKWVQFWRKSAVS